MNEFMNLGQFTECGTELISPHMRWLIRKGVLKHCPEKALNCICYREATPTNHFGEAHSPSGSIVINLHRHFDSALSAVQSKDGIHSSLKYIITKELIDTAIHEAHHLKISYESKNFDNSNMEEEEASQLGREESAQLARYFDVDVPTFGKYIDDLLQEIIEDLRVSTKEEPKMWKDFQIYMWDNNLGYYDPDKDLELSISEAFQASQESEEPWIEEPQKFVREDIEVSPTIQPQDHQMPEPGQEQYETTGKLIPPMETLGQSLPTNNNLTNPVIPPEQYLTPQGENQPTQQQPQVQQPQVQQSQVQSTPTITVDQIVTTCEAVLRQLFWHVYSKCGHDGHGNFTNPTAVLEPVDINHIPFANDIFKQMDTYNEQGTWTANVPCNGQIKGKLSSKNLPVYALHLDYGNGVLHKRTFMPMNPGKTNADGSASTWAKDAQNGVQRMMFLDDNGTRAVIELQAGGALGQETFKLMNN